MSKHVQFPQRLSHDIKRNVKQVMKLKQKWNGSHNLKKTK